MTAGRRYCIIRLGDLYMRLLIAEDELDLAEALTVFFEKNQFSVDTVHDGFAAYDYASTGEYDAIVLDVMMPKMDGVQVLQRLREEGVRTPVMMLTAKSRQGRPHHRLQRRGGRLSAQAL